MQFFLNTIQVSLQYVLLLVKSFTVSKTTILKICNYERII